MIALGLMSGTSRDGIDVALIETDGENIVRPLAAHDAPYEPRFRESLAKACARALTLQNPQPDVLIDEVTAQFDALHIQAAHELIQRCGIVPDVIGMHGHTVAHRPDNGWTWQIGNGATVAQELGITVVDDFRMADVQAGGQGAPLIPIYHRALLGLSRRSAMVLNLGGVANITAVAGDGHLIACDTGMASALIDDWVLAHTGAAYDADGALAAQGTVDEVALAAMMAHPFFAASPPKSLDRADFNTVPVAHLNPADGAATLTAFSAAGVARVLDHLPERPQQIYVAGGGRKNATLMQMIETRCGVPVQRVEALGWNGDATEAEGFAYMAVRTLRGLPISFPGTTGVGAAQVGGVVHLVGRK